MAGEIVGKNIPEIFDASPAPEDIDMGSLVYTAVKTAGDYEDGATTLAALARRFNSATVDWDATPSGDDSSLPDFENESVETGGTITQVDANHWQAVFPAGAGAGSAAGAASKSASRSLSPSIEVEIPTSAVQVVIIFFDAGSSLSEVASGLFTGGETGPIVAVPIFPAPSGPTVTDDITGGGGEELDNLNMATNAGTNAAVVLNPNGTVTATIGGTTQTTTSTFSLPANVKVGALVGYAGSGEAATVNVHPVGSPLTQAPFPAGAIKGTVLEVTQPGPLDGVPLQAGDRVEIGEGKNYIHRPASNEPDLVDEETFNQKTANLTERTAALEVAGLHRFFLVYMDEETTEIPDLSPYAGAIIQLKDQGGARPNVVNLPQSAWDSVPDQTEVSFYNNAWYYNYSDGYVILTGAFLPGFGGEEIRIPHGEMVTIKKVQSTYIDVEGITGTTSVDSGWKVLGDLNKGARDKIEKLQLSQAFTRYDSGITSETIETVDWANKSHLVSAEEPNFTITIATGTGNDDLEVGEKFTVFNVTDLDNDTASKPIFVNAPFPYGVIKLWPGHYLTLQRVLDEVDSGALTPRYTVTTNAETNPDVLQTISDIVDDAITLTSRVDDLEDPDTTFPDIVAELSGADKVLINKASAYGASTLNTLKEWLQFKNNLSATGSPGLTNDSSEGYEAGSRWLDNAPDPKVWWICTDATEDAAVWDVLSLSADELGTAALLNSGDAPGDVVLNSELGTAARANFSGMPFFNQLPHSGRFSDLTGNPYRLALVGGFLNNSFFEAFNGSTAAGAGQFFHNNSTFGGAGPALDPTVEDLITAMQRFGGDARLGVEFFVAEITAGAGTSSSSGSGSDGTKYLMTLTGQQNIVSADDKCTFCGWLRCTAGTIYLRSSTGYESLHVDGVSQPVGTGEDNFELSVADGWKFVRCVSSGAIGGYNNIWPNLLGANGDKLQIACPAAYPGVVDPGIYKGPQVSAGVLL